MSKAMKEARRVASGQLSFFNDMMAKTQGSNPHSSGHGTAITVPVPGGTGLASPYITNGTITTSGFKSSTGVNGTSFAIRQPDTLQTGKTLTTPLDELPDMQMSDVDENGVCYDITFCPEHNISSFESLKLMQMLLAYAAGQNFSPYAFIKKHNYERHFKITTP